MRFQIHLNTETTTYVLDFSDEQFKPEDLRLKIMNIEGETELTGFVKRADLKRLAKAI